MRRPTPDLAPRRTLEITRAERPVARDAIQHLRPVILGRQGRAPGPLFHLCAQALALALPQGPDCHGQDDGVVGKVLKNQPIPRQQAFQHPGPILRVPAPQDMVMGAGNHAQGVELHHAKPLDNSRQPSLTQ